MNSNTPYIANLVNSIIGVSVLAMPYCMKKCGLFLGLVILLSSCWLTYISCSMLLTSAVAKRRRTYEYLAASTIGPSGKFAVELSMIGLMLGTCVAFYVIIGDLATEIVSTFVDVDHDLLRTYVIIFCGICVALPLGLMKSLAALGFIGYFSLIFYFIFVCVMFSTSVNNGLLSLKWVENITFFQPSGVFQCLPIFSLAYACHCQLFVVYDSLDDPSIPKMDYIVKSSLKIVTFVYFLVAIFGYTTFSSEVEGNVLKNFPSTTLLVFIKMGFATSVVVGFPLMIFPCRQSIHTLFFRQTYSDGLAPKTYIEPFTFKLLTFSIVSLTMIVAILIPNVETILGLTGATMGSLICFIMPAIIFMKSDYTTNHKVPKFVLGVGCLLFVVCTYSNVYPAVEEVAKVESVFPDKPNPVIIPNIVEKVFPEVVNDKELIKVENVHRHEPANPEPPAISFEHDDSESVDEKKKPDMPNKNVIPNQIESVEKQVAKKEELVINNKEQGFKKVEEKDKDSDIKKEEEIIAPEKNQDKIVSEELLQKKPFQEVKEVKVDPSKKPDEEEAAVNQAKLLKKLKESNKVQSDLLEQQRKLLKVLESKSQTEEVTKPSSFLNNSSVGSDVKKVLNKNDYMMNQDKKVDVNKLGQKPQMTEPPKQIENSPRHNVQKPIIKRQVKPLNQTKIEIKPEKGRPIVEKVEVKSNKTKTAVNDQKH